MGVLADLYVASEDEEALKYDATPDAFGDRRQYGAVTALELSTLWAIMQHHEWDAVLMEQFPELLGEEDGERWIHRLPKSMTEALTRMTQEEVVVSATAWAKTDELRCQPGDVQPIIEGLIELSKVASARGKAVYLWNSL